MTKALFTVPAAGFEGVWTSGETIELDFSTVTVTYGGITLDQTEYRINHDHGEVMITVNENVLLNIVG